MTGKKPRILFRRHTPRLLRGSPRSSRARIFAPGSNKILRNAFLTSRTGLKAAATVPLDLEGEEEVLPAVRETPESILLQRSDGQLVRQALEQLPVAYREVLLLEMRIKP